jgi:hypothetical protein
MSFTKEIKIGGGVTPMSFGKAVRVSIVELTHKSEIATEREREKLADVVWITGNLTEQDGRYFPLLSVNTEEDSAYLEAAIQYLQKLGFGGTGWSIERSKKRISLRGLNPFPTGAQEGFVFLSGLVWDACNKTSFSYGAVQ